MWKDFFINNEKTRRDRVRKSLENVSEGQTILDAWAGEMQYKQYCKHLLYTSQDFNQYDGKWDGVWGQMWSWERSTDITSDIINIPVENWSYDNILCTEVLEHIPYPDKAIQEFSRILKTWWKLILTAPFCSLTHFSPYYFSNGFSEYRYKKILGDCGLEIVELTKNWNYFNYLEQENARLPSMAKKYWKQNILVVLLISFLALIQIFILKYLWRNDKWSSEMLCFWTHIIAIKK